MIRRSSELGLVHFVDNAAEGVKHNCNCCGCACWNVGTIKRRKIPRDVLMVGDEWCIGCGVCAMRCDYQALRVKYGEGRAEVPADFAGLHRTILEE